MLFPYRPSRRKIRDGKAGEGKEAGKGEFVTSTDLTWFGCSVREWNVSEKYIRLLGRKLRLLRRGNARLLHSRRGPEGRHTRASRVRFEVNGVIHREVRLGKLWIDPNGLMVIALVAQPRFPSTPRSGSSLLGPSITPPPTLTDH